MCPTVSVQTTRATLLELQSRTSEWTPWTSESAADPEAWRETNRAGSELCGQWMRFYSEVSCGRRVDVAKREIAKLANMELSRAAQEFARNLRTGDKWRALETCQGVRRRFLSASVAYRRELRRVDEDDACDQAFVAELTLSLRCRLSLARLWTRVESTRERSTHRRLRLGGAAIASLRGDEAYPSLNLRDRLTLLGLQQRILKWLRAPDEEEGAALLQDLEGMVAITRQMNKRAELQEHDAFAVRKALDQLAILDGMNEDEVEPASLAAMRLLGMAPELDHCLRKERAEIQEVERMLEHFAGRFEVASGRAAARPDELLEASSRVWADADPERVARV